MKRRLSAIVAAGLACLSFATPAAAEFGPIELASGGAGQPADRALAPAISADGHYLAFEASLGGFEGVFRKDLSSGQILRVAGASTSDPQLSSLKATEPAISADGRYVSFTTRARLDPANDLLSESRDVYVADMATASPITPPGYELASALGGCDPATQTGCGFTYGTEGNTGSEATGRVSLSADGRKLVFVTSAPTNLTSGPSGSTPGVPTPARQVMLRDLASDTTTLVSVERDSGTGAMTERPVAGGALVSTFALSLLRGAALSADGTTVAWVGAHLPAQVPLQPGEEGKFTNLDNGITPYNEPLWRRIADGPTAPTRRIVAGDGAADPFPDMTQKDDLVNIAQGWIGREKVNGVPQLSADGKTVVLIGNPTEAMNLFLVDMAPGLSRGQAVRQLTREIVVDPFNPAGTINIHPYVPLTGHIFDLGISPDASSIAFATARQRFPLAPPNMIGSPPSSPGLVELYLLDRGSESIQRVTHGASGVDEPSDDPTHQDPESASEGGAGASSPSLAAGGLISFASTATNLVAGDSNEASDVFLVENVVGPRVPTGSTIDPGPTVKQPSSWHLTLRAFSLPNGDVRVVAGVPAAGQVRAKVSPEPDVEVGARKLAAAKRRAPKLGRVAIQLELPKRLRPLARTREGLYGVARVSFHGRGRKTLHGRVQVHFHVHPGGGRSR